MDKKNLLSELLDKEEFQKLQDTFALSLGLSFITVDYRGEPVIEYSGFTDFCKTLRENEACRKRCFQCDAHGGLHATITGEPYIYKCHAGLIDFAVPLIVNGEYLGAVMGGQVELSGEAPELSYILPQRTEWEPNKALADARKHVHRSSYPRLEASVRLLRETIQSLLERNYQKVTAAELEQKDQELLEEKEARISMEEKMAHEQAQPLWDYLREDEMFYTLNTISSLAFLEHAEQTQQMVCDFSNMLRCLMSNGQRSFVTVGEELEYTELYLRIQKKRLEGRFFYEINVPEEFYGVACPFMILQPLVQNSLRYAIEGSQAGGTLSIDAKRDGELLALSISDSGSGMTTQQITALLDFSGVNGEKTNFLTNTNRMLKELYGSRCGIFIRSIEDGYAGTEVQVKLPVRSREKLI